MAKDNGQTIFEVLEYGPVMAADEELGLLVTVNGAYFNLWVGYDDSWQNTDAYDMRSRVNADSDPSNGLYGTLTVELMTAAEELLAEIIAGDEDE